ncbi:hypothetical protein EVAR_81878_1 [Eumeta japonica]|uniref:Uncharacterized protein n=1 Tax=Eumeta variegata TaxID=151549 RepID=A0A4C1UXK7_EUMVA|nr:hypothetical protein EVAR_81878_1 [Eumeta japonica]
METWTVNNKDAPPSSTLTALQQTLNRLDSVRDVLTLFLKIATRVAGLTYENVPDYVDGFAGTGVGYCEVSRAHYVQLVTERVTGCRWRRPVLLELLLFNMNLLQ